jgi:hypothetical protein
LILISISSITVGPLPLIFIFLHPLLSNIVIFKKKNY